MSTIEPDAPMSSSLTFALLSAVAGFGPTMFLYAAVLVPVLALAPSGEGLDSMPKAALPVLVIVYAVLLLVMQAGGLFFNAGLDHLALKLTHGTRQPYSVTVRAQALSMAPYIVGLVPLCGVYVFPIWATVLRIFGIMHLHRTTGGRATLVVLVPLALLCGVCGFGYLLSMAAMFALASGG